MILLYIFIDYSCWPRLFFFSPSLCSVLLCSRQFSSRFLLLLSSLSITLALEWLLRASTAIGLPFNRPLHLISSLTMHMSQRNRWNLNEPRSCLSNVLWNVANYLLALPLSLCCSFKLTSLCCNHLNWTHKKQLVSWPNETRVSPLTRCSVTFSATVSVYARPS